MTKINDKKITTKQLVYSAIFAAISVAINTIRFGFFSFGGLPIIMSGYALGPNLGFIVGAVADIVGVIVRPPASGGVNPLFTLTSALTGFIPVFITTKLGDKYPKWTYWKVLIGIVIGQYITSVTLVPIFMSLIAGKNIFWPYFTKALIKQTIQAPFYAFLTKIILERISTTINFRTD